MATDVVWTDLIPANQPMALAALARSVEALTSEVVDLHAEVRALRAGPVAVPDDARRLVSLREAARLLGISRTRTLPALIREQRIHVVKVNGKPKIAMHEIERIGSEGASAMLPPLASEPQKQKRPSPPKQSRAPLARDLV
jgi:hypothetical protein